MRDIHLTASGFCSDGVSEPSARAIGATSKLNTTLLMNEHAAPMLYHVQRAGAHPKFGPVNTYTRVERRSKDLRKTETPHLRIAQALSHHAPPVFMPG